METQLSQFILNKNFPCVMAKAVVKTGLIKVFRFRDKHHQLDELLEQMYLFIDEYRANPKKLRSFVVILDDESSLDFKHYEDLFWDLLSSLSIEDKKQFIHDQRVSDNPQDPEFSYSLKSEAFFILGLHPKSPRLARRFSKPAIVFNLHQQFEQMRKKGIFIKIRNLIRFKDKMLQGSVNTMLSDFGERSEIFQYLGKVYKSANELNLNKGFFYGSY